MVDPNRKINHLTDDDAAYLVECEQEFRHRFTDADEEFVAFCARPTQPPPIVEPWRHQQGGNNRNRGGGNNWNRNSGNNWNRDSGNNRRNYRPNNQNYQHRNDNRGPSNHHQYRSHHNKPYDRNYQRDNDNGGHGSSHQY